jgi:hypothetical protein
MQHIYNETKHHRTSKATGYCCCSENSLQYLQTPSVKHIKTNVFTVPAISKDVLNRNNRKNIYISGSCSFGDE